MGEPNRNNPWRSAHMGLEFAGAALVMTFVGYYIDLRYGSKPWGAVIGATVGFTGGMYLFIKQALRANRESSKKKP